MREFGVAWTRATTFCSRDGSIKTIAEVSLSVREYEELTDEEIYVAAIRDEKQKISYFVSKVSLFEKIIRGNTIRPHMFLLSIMPDDENGDDKIDASEYPNAFRYAAYLCCHVGIPLDIDWVRNPMDGLIPEVCRATIYKLGGTKTILYPGSAMETTEDLIEGVGSLLNEAIILVQDYQEAFDEPISDDEDVMEMFSRAAESAREDTDEF